MGSIIEEKMKPGALANGGAQSTLLEKMNLVKEMQDQSGTRKVINSELWHACAGPLVSLPQVGSLVYYFPQGHSEQVAVSTKRTSTSQIPNYPNLPSQLMCQVHNVTLHADRDTDEIYAQMSLQPVNSERDVYPVPGFGFKLSKHPNEFFCKTLTASDTSTHGGFSVPRRAAEKLFPPLDFTMQPPTQELVVRDLHDNTWTFRHIYRGQPKRHLLTTGWSLFVGSKRLRAGDSVLFIRDEKSQLMVGVRRANRQQTTLPSSVLSADSMHIGVLAAAAHAAANRSPFTIFYNPRACPSEFVIPLPKYRKLVYGSQVSVGMRFGMMFETEESGKRRYMGTIVGISDLDPLRWPGSKWRNIQVEWDEPGCNDKQNKVSAWDIEIPDGLFIFPSLTSGLKRPLYPGYSGLESEWGSLVKRPLQFPENGNIPNSISNLYSEQLMKMMLKPQLVNNNHPGNFPSTLQQQFTDVKPSPLEEMKNLQSKSNQNQLIQSENTLTENQNLSHLIPGQPKPKHSAEQLTSTSECNSEKPVANATSATMSNQLSFPNQNQIPLQGQNNLWLVQSPLDSSVLQAHQTFLSQADFNTLNSFLPFSDMDDWTSNISSCQPLAGVYKSPSPISMVGLQDSSAVFSVETDASITTVGQDIWDQKPNNCRLSSEADQLASFTQQDPCSRNSSGMRDLSDDSNNQNEIYNSCAKIDFSNGGSTVIDPFVSSVGILAEFCSLKDADFQNPSDCLVGNFSSCQDVQSQITSSSLADSQALSLQDLPASSGGTSRSNIDFDESGLLQNNSWKQRAPRVRTYTKVQKAGSVGRSIDVTSFKNYYELICAIECMFGLKGLLDDPKGSGWKLVYVDYENDVLLVGDDPWEEFVGCVRCVRILSPTEVQQMSEEGMKLLNSAATAINGSDSDGCNANA